MSQETSLEEGIAGAEVLRQKHVVQNTFMNSQFSGGWETCNDEVQPIKGCGKTRRCTFPPGETRREGGGDVPHLSSLPWHIVPWL